MKTINLWEVLYHVPMDKDTFTGMSEALVAVDTIAAAVEAVQSIHPKAKIGSVHGKGKVVIPDDRPKLP